MENWWNLRRLTSKSDNPYRTAPDAQSDKNRSCSRRWACRFFYGSTYFPHADEACNKSTEAKSQRKKIGCMLKGKSRPILFSMCNSRKTWVYISVLRMTCAGSCFGLNTKNVLCEQLVNHLLTFCIHWGWSGSKGDNSGLGTFHSNQAV